VPSSTLPAGGPETPPETAPGTLLAGKYRVERTLGIGGMGVVVEATHEVLHEKVAVKFLLSELASNPQLTARFLREAQAAVRIKSPHVARVIDVGTLESGSPYMVMEYLEGRDLGAILAAEGPLSPRAAVTFVLQACEAIASAHGAGVVHRDLKPPNLFVTSAADGTPTLKVLDFGISKLTEPGASGSLTQTQVAMGSPFYMSPEQIRSTREVDGRTDIWALGVVLYELLTGAVPFESDSMPALCALVLESEPTALSRHRPDVPPALEAVVAKCLAKDVTKRYQNVAELALALAPFAGTFGRQSAGRSARIVGIEVPVDARESTAPGLLDAPPSRAPKSQGKTSTPEAFASTAVGPVSEGVPSLREGPASRAAERTGTSFGTTQPPTPTAADAPPAKRPTAWILVGAAALLGVGGLLAFGGGEAPPPAPAAVLESVPPKGVPAKTEPAATPPPQVAPEAPPPATSASVAPAASASAAPGASAKAPASGAKAAASAKPAAAKPAEAKPNLYDDRR